MSCISIAIWAESLFGPYTGTRTFLENLIRHSLECYPHRASFTLICPSWADPEQLANRFPEGNWKVMQALGRRWPNRLAWLAGLSSISPVVGRHDIYLSGWQWPLGKLDEPFVAILHDLRMLDPAWEDQTVSAIRRFVWRKLWDLSVKSCVSRSATIITPSQYTLDHLARLGYVACQPTIVIPHGVDHEVWSVKADDSQLHATLRKIGAYPGRDYVFSIGQHTPHKNFKRLIEGFATGVARDDPMSQLIIVGAENVETYELRDTISRHSLQDRITLAGSVTFDELRALMSRARVFAFPSLFEGFGLPVLEAFSAGIPVVTSRTTSLGEIANKAAVLVDPRDIAEIGSAIVNVWSNEALRSNLVEIGKTHATKYCWNDCVGRYLDIFESVVNLSGTKA